MLTKHGKATHWTPQRITEILSAFITAKRRPPMTREWGTQGLPSIATARRLLGPVGALQTHLMAGLVTRHETVLARIQTFVAAYHRWPATKDFHPRRGLPHAATVYRLFGSLAEARRQAGMPGGGYEGHGAAPQTRRRTGGYPA